MLYRITLNAYPIVNYATFFGLKGIIIENVSKLSIPSARYRKLVTNDSFSIATINLLHAPLDTINLLYVQKLCANNKALIEFQSNSYCVKDIDSKEVLLQRHNDNGLYKVYGVISNSI